MKIKNKIKFNYTVIWNKNVHLLFETALLTMIEAVILVKEDCG